MLPYCAIEEDDGDSDNEIYGIVRDPVSDSEAQEVIPNKLGIIYVLEVGKVSMLLFQYYSQEFTSYMLDSYYSDYSGSDSEEDVIVYDYDDFQLLSVVLQIDNLESQLALCLNLQILHQFMNLFHRFSQDLGSNVIVLVVTLCEIIVFVVTFIIVNAHFLSVVLRLLKLLGVKYCSKNGDLESVGVEVSVGYQVWMISCIQTVLAYPSFPDLLLLEPSLASVLFLILGLLKQELLPLLLRLSSSAS
ncbi:MAG: hypothetical protein EZS28_034614, partial [Streblomastix strix]